MNKIRIKGKVYELEKIKGQIILILEEKKIGSIKTWEIVIKGITVIITKVSNLKILHYPKLFLIQT